MSEAKPPAGPEGPPPGSTGPWGDPAQQNQWTAPPYQPTVPVEQPSSIRTAVRLMWVGAALGAIGIIVAFAQTDELRDQIRESDSSLTADEVDTAVAVGLTFIGVIGVIGVGLWLWMAVTNGKGKAWARTVATVLGGLNILFTAFGLLGDQLTPLNLVVSVVSIALAVAILVLLYRPESNDYYDYRTRTST